MQSRFVLALFAAGALCTSAALAAPPIGASPIGAPPVHVPPVNAPPAGVPPVQAPPARANARGSASLDVLHGTVTAVNGTAVTVKLSNGTTQTFTVSQQTASRLQSRLNKAIVYRAQNGTLTLVGAGAAAMQGTLVALSGTTAQIKLANGTTQTYTITAQQAAWLKVHTGKRIAFRANTDGTIELNQRSHATKASQRSHRKPK